MSPMFGTFVRWDGKPGFQPRVFPGLAANHWMVGQPCIGCGLPFEAGDETTLVPIGPGADLDAQRKHAEGRWYNAAAVPVHAACAGATEQAG